MSIEMMVSIGYWGCALVQVDYAWRPVVIHPPPEWPSWDIQSTAEYSIQVQITDSILLVLY